GLAVVMILLVSCLGVIAGVLGYLALLGRPPRVVEPSPAPELDDPLPIDRIPRLRIRVDGVVALSPDGERVAGSRGGRVRMVNLRTTREVRALPGDVPGPATTLMFSPDGRWLAAAGGTPTMGGSWARVWNLRSGESWEPPPFVTRGHLKESDWPLGFVSN